MRPRWRGPSAGDIDEGGSTSCGVEGKEPLADMSDSEDRGFIFLIFSSLISCGSDDTENTTNVEKYTSSPNSIAPSPIKNNTEFSIPPQCRSSVQPSGRSQRDRRAKGENSKCAPWRHEAAGERVSALSG